MTRAVHRTLGGLLAITFAWSPLFAQQSSRVLETGLGAVYFPDDDQLVWGPWAHGEARRVIAGARTRGAADLIAGSGSASGSAQTSAWWRNDLGERAWWEAGAEGSALFGSRLHSSESVLGGVRIGRTFSPAVGAWLIGTGHLAWREAGMLRGGGLEASSWRRLPRALITASLLHERAQGQLFASGSRDRVLGTVPVRYDEASVTASADEWWGTLDAMAGARRDPDATRLLEPMWRVSTLLWQAATRAVSVNVARLPADFIHGADASYSVSIGLHIGARGMVTEATRTSRPIAELVRLAGSEGRTLRVRAPGARAVEVMADFTGWESLALTREASSRSDSDFTLPRALSSGTHRLMLRVDGGPWLPPANLPQVDDDFGGKVGLLVAP